MRMRVAWLMGGLAAVLAVAGCAETVPDAPPTSAPVATSPADPLERARHSVVTVKAEQAAASGVVITADGHVLTSEAVAGDGPLTVTLPDGDTVEATLVGTDARTQLAVVRLAGAVDLAPLSFAEEPVAASAEVRSATGPELPEGGPGIVLVTHHLAGAVSAILTDAPAEQGSAGGPLLDAGGAVVGIVTGALAPVDGATPGAVAVPAALASRVAEELIDRGEVAHPYLGVTLEEADGAGARVQDVAGGSPAAQAGLRPGDLITALDGRQVDGPGAVVAHVQAGAVGDELTVTYTRDGTTEEAVVTLGEAPGG